MASVADLCIVPVQDYLGLSKTARMNTPSTMEGNWRWRLLPGRLTNTMADEILDLVVTYKRR
jgi:4-alpha-glucanotransferase